MKIKAQSTLEFTFAMIVIIFLIYGMVRVFRWAGMDLANRRVTQDSSLMTLDINGDPSLGLSDNTADLALPMSAVYHGSITNGNTSQ
jgi:hypothetical protein